MMELFWIISQQDRVKLMQYQWEHYREKLDIPPEPAQPAVKEPPPEEAPAEYIQEMRQPPHSPRLVP